jgi:hydrogenase maturation protease
MNLLPVEKIANAVLYEGYILYPYRASSVKNQKRFNFGVLVPPAYSAAENGTETSSMQTECLVEGDPQAALLVKVRFLQPAYAGAWMEAIERVVGPVECRLSDLADRPRREPFDFPMVRGTLELAARRIGERLHRLTVRISNETPLDSAGTVDREQILPHSCASTHTILGVEGGEFVSLLDPPGELSAAAQECRNVGTWPILAGDEGQRSLMLSSPIILYDYAQVATESPGDLFDGAEIDEILTLRIMTMTDEEKREMREGDDRGRQILERTESLPAEHFMKLHGALRGMRPAEGGER